MDPKYVGNEWAVHLLKEHVIRASVRHAYLFTGPPGVGRRTLALRFAQVINCLQPPAPGQACGTCSTCKRIAAMQHPDLSIVQSDAEGASLKVEPIRDLQHSLALTPFEAKYRIGLLLRFEEATISAQNALLKTLEEPNPNVILLLTASSAEDLLPTIVSRCETVRLNPLSVAELTALLQQDGVDHTEAQKLAHLSSGRAGLAYRFRTQPDLLKKRTDAFAVYLDLLSSKHPARFIYAEKATKGGNRKDDVRASMIYWLSFWRDVMLTASESSAPITNIDLLPQVQKAASQVGFQSAFRCTTAVERTIERIDKNVNLRLALEVLFLDIPVLAL